MTAPEPNHTPAKPGAALLEGQRNNSGPVLLLQPGLKPSASFEIAIRTLLEQLESQFKLPIVLTSLSNAESDLNPFSGISPADETAIGGEQAGQLVSLLGTGRIFEWNQWPAHAVLVSESAAEVLAGGDTTAANAFARLQAAGGRVLLSDALFLHDETRGLFDAPKLEPHERALPAPWGGLRERLDAWLRHPLDQDSARALAAFASEDSPVCLHITHSWGGGVAQWVESFIDADDKGVNLQLRAEGPQSGKGCGQRLSLYLGNRLETPLASWWLQPPIRSSAGESNAYRKILKRVLDRCGVGRVIVSSLVGHSLDALASGRPTIQVLHDFYPAWPLLGVHPGPYLGPDEPGEILGKALSENRLIPEFRDRDADGWARLGRNWLEKVRHWGVHVAAPSRSVADLLRELEPGWRDVDIDIIPHGLPEIPGEQTVQPREREDGRLRLVIPGRIQPGKGKQLLLDALPELTQLAQVYLLGAGKDGEAFFGISGVDVIMQYERGKLRERLAEIGPHVAALLSVVPETFSYTLSEMQQLNIPVIATRVGSLAERVADGENGWLIEPDAGALVDRVRRLSENRAAIATVRERLQDVDMPGTAEMVARYDKLCKPKKAARKRDEPAGSEAIQAGALADENRRLRNQLETVSGERDTLETEVKKRTRWAEDREQARKDEKERAIRWVARVEQQASEQLAAERAEREQIVGNLEGMLGRLQAEHDYMLGTLSWRLTKPLRVLRRVFSNLTRAGAWNPMRWPFLFSQAYRTVRTRGLRGALMRAQLEQGQQFAPERIDAAAVDSIGDPEPPQALPAASDPEVSIVIPVYNEWLYTAACLRSLVETSNKATFEVIVVDDHSSDETPERLADIEGLVYLRNEKNLGFIGSCNRGAAAASGRYLVMLNNDTQVMDGWLDALLKTFTTHPDTGLAGARLIYPDGSLQEAGGIIFNDGSGWNYGRNAEADRPEYQYLREVDYCSGACIMVPRELFDEMGGFDSAFAPAYYEDTDLAFRIREKGLKVRIQPAATIVHHEGVTSGTDIGSGAKRYQAVNREKFLERWSEQLSRQPAPVVNPEDEAEIRRARDHHLKGRILVVDAYTPEPDQDSGSVRLTYLLKCLVDLGYGVTFMPDNQAFAGRYTTDLQQAGIEVVYRPWAGSLQRFFSERGAEFDFVMVSRHYVASRYINLVRRHCPGARFIFDTVDLHYLREERLAKLENSLPLQRTAAQTRRSELAVIEASDATLVVSPVEKTVLAEAMPNARVHVISNVHEVVGSRKPFADRKDMFFVGGYQHPPNIDAAQWFVGSIWPLIREELPDVQFHLIGSKAPDEIRALDGNGVRFHGFVESLEPWLDNCRLALAPLRYGAGVKGKVNMSMSRGQPVVATPMAVEGMFARPGQDVLVAETEKDFAAEVVRIYRDEALWNRVSACGLENVSRYFSVETARRGLQELLTSL